MIRFLDGPARGRHIPDSEEATMIFTALSEAAEKGQLILVRDGICRWYLRKDNVVVIREMLVLPFRRGTGVGRAMLAELQAGNRGRIIRARCPSDYPSNGFWAHSGFKLVCSAQGINTWEYPG